MIINVKTIRISTKISYFFQWKQITLDFWRFVYKNSRENSHTLFIIWHLIHQELMIYEMKWEIRENRSFEFKIVFCSIKDLFAAKYKSIFSFTSYSSYHMKKMQKPIWHEINKKFIFHIFFIVSDTEICLKYNNHFWIEWYEWVIREKAMD